MLKNPKKNRPCSTKNKEIYDKPPQRETYDSDFECLPNNCLERY